MEKTPNRIDEQLLDYLDNKLSPAEKSSIENMLTARDDLKKRLQNLKTIAHNFRGQKPEEPSKNFTFSVMNRLDESPAITGLSTSNGIFLLIGVILAMGIGAWLLSAGVFDQSNTTIDLNKIPLTQQYIRFTLPSIPVDGKLVVNIIVFLNLALALIVLDRVILKPLFQRRIQPGQ